MRPYSRVVASASVVVFALPLVAAASEDHSAHSGQPVATSAAAGLVDDCAEEHYVDRSGASAPRVITWDYSFPSTAERCIRIHMDQTVRWNGNFADHPLDPDQGDAPNPIAQHDGSGVITFSRPGTFGFRCNYHFEMRGAVQVIAPAAPAAVPGTGRMGAVTLASLLLLGGAMIAAARWQKQRRFHGGETGS